MRVEMDGQAHLFLQRADQRARGGGFQKPRHVLEPEDVRAGIAERLAHLDVILEVVFRPVGIIDVAGVADGPFADLVRLEHRIHRDAHVLDPVEAVEDAEHVDPALGGLLHESLNHVVGVVGVAHAVGAAEQHLRHQVRHLGADVTQALPGAFLQEAVGHIEGGTAPAFDRKKLRQVRRVTGRHLDHVDGPHARCQQRLVAVPHRGVGDQKLLLRGHPIRHGLRAFFVQKGARAFRRRIGTGRRRLRGLEIGGGLGPALGLGMPVHGDVGNIGQNLGAAVLARLEVEELGRLVDEGRGVAIVLEGRVLEQVLHELDISRHAPDAELAQRPIHPLDRLFRRRGPGGDLHQQRIVVARDHPARVGRAAVEADAHAGGGAVGGDAAVVGDEIVGRVLGGDPGLQRVAIQRDVVLAGLARGLGQGFALGDHDLRLHDVDAGDFLGHGMLDLDAGVHLDEVESAGFHIHQELDGAGAFVVHMRADLAAKLAEFFALGVRQIGRGRAFHDLLVAALHRAVAFEQMVDIAVAVAEDLHLDVAGAGDHLLEIALAVAEGGLGLAAAFLDLVLELGLGMNGAHAAPAAAPRRLEHQRIADLFGLGANGVHVVAQNLGRRDDRHAGLDRDAPRAGLVAERAHGLCPGADEGDARGVAGIDEAGVLRQKAVARMDRIGPGLLGHADDLWDREIGLDRPQPLADAVGLIGLEAVQPELVLFGEDRDGLLSHLVGRAHDADGDLAAIGDEDLLEFWHRERSFAGKGVICF